MSKFPIANMIRNGVRVETPMGLAQEVAAPSWARTSAPTGGDGKSAATTKTASSYPTTNSVNQPDRDTPNNTVTQARIVHTHSNPAPGNRCKTQPKETK